jgi:hypothetical protein
MTINGPFADNYLKTDQLGLETTVWSPCGSEGMLNINSEVRINPIDTVKNSLMTVRTTLPRRICTQGWGAMANTMHRSTRRI